ncbi:hypothetical protein RP20_CCG005137 [Aedes albopictus]|nr:hypothetical protein RP20_CCG005137 [Aedes albopictus]
MQYPVMLVVILLVLGGKVVVSIEVYENINENGTDSEAPLKSTLPNSVVSNGSQLAINEPGKDVSVTTSAVDYTRNDSGSGNQQQPAVDNHRHQQKQQHHKHSPSYRDTPLPITPTTTTTVVSVTTSTSKGSPVVLSSAASPTASSGSAFKEDSVLKDIVGANLVQQQISGYKKRQLYANAFQVAKNGTNERSYEKQRNRQLSKEFIPSPELTHFSPNAEDHRPFQPGPAVDATYPASPVDNDSKWFGANHISIPESYHEHVPPKYEHHKSGKYLWLPNGPSNHNIPSSDSPFSRTKSRLPSPPKGKWKWVPEDEDASDVPQQTEKPMESAKAPDLESKIISGGHYFLGHLPPRDHPYSFDAGQTPFSADGVGSGGGAVSTASSSSTTIDPLMYFFGPSTTAVVDTGKQKTGAKGDSDALKGVSPWKKIIHVLSAAIPIGLIISALTPQVVYINPNMTHKNSNQFAILIAGIVLNLLSQEHFSAFIFDVLTVKTTKTTST